MFFVAVEFSDQKLARAFELLRIVLEPDAARRAHVTLRGPYEHKKNINKSVFNRDVGRMTVRPPKHFFSDITRKRVQNTVYLEIEILHIDEFWHKPDYPDGIPHLTIYDGPDRNFAWTVFNMLKRHQWRFAANSSPLKILERKQSVESAYLTELDEYKFLIDQAIGRKASMGDFRKMTSLERINAANTLCHIIHDISRPFSSR